MIGLLDEPSNDDAIVPESFSLDIPEVELSFFFLEEGGSLGGELWCKRLEDLGLRMS